MREQPKLTTFEFLERFRAESVVLSPWEVNLTPSAMRQLWRARVRVLPGCSHFAHQADDQVAFADGPEDQVDLVNERPSGERWRDCFRAVRA